MLFIEKYLWQRYANAEYPICISAPIIGRIVLLVSDHKCSEDLLCSIGAIRGQIEIIKKHSFRRNDWQLFVSRCVPMQHYKPPYSFLPTRCSYEAFFRTCGLRPTMVQSLQNISCHCQQICISCSFINIRSGLVNMLSIFMAQIRQRCFSYLHICASQRDGNVIGSIKITVSYFFKTYYNKHLNNYIIIYVFRTFA